MTCSRAADFSREVGCHAHRDQAHHVVDDLRGHIWHRHRGAKLWKRRACIGHLVTQVQIGPGLHVRKGLHALLDYLLQEELASRAAVMPASVRGALLAK